MTKAIIGYMGGKYKMSKQIISYMADHKVYVEPFFGSGGVFFNKKYKDVSNVNNYIEAINDLNFDVTNFFEQLRDNYESMVDKLEFYEYSDYAMKTMSPSIDGNKYHSADNITKACMFFRVVNSSFGGDYQGMDKIGFGKTRSIPSHVENKKNFIKYFANRLKKAYIHNRSYDFMIKSYDSPDTLFYLDPPYFGCTPYAIQKSLPFDFDKFVGDVKSIKGKWMLSHYKSDWLLNNFSEYNIIDIKHTPSICKAVGCNRPIKEDSNECIVLNYDPSKVKLFDNSNYNFFDLDKVNEQMKLY